MCSALRPRTSTINRALPQLVQLSTPLSGQSIRHVSMTSSTEPECLPPKSTSTLFTSSAATSSPSNLVQGESTTFDINRINQRVDSQLDLTRRFHNLSTNPFQQQQQ